jgi:hypothetical protein
MDLASKTHEHINNILVTFKDPIFAAPCGAGLKEISLFLSIPFAVDSQALQCLAFPEEIVNDLVVTSLKNMLGSQLGHAQT